MLSAGILGYPSPTLINWGQTFDDPSLVEGGSHIAKITGIQSFLAGIPVERDEDLALMVDGYDIVSWILQSKMHQVSNSLLVVSASTRNSSEPILRHQPSCQPAYSWRAGRGCSRDL